MKGKIIEFEGTDCSFKETNTKKLYEYIKDNITDKVLLISFPNYKGASSQFVKKYLNGDYGTLDEVNPYQASIFYALDRFDTMKKLNINKLLEEGYYIILDRYVGSNILYQSTKFMNDNTIYAKNKFIKWCIDLEYNKLKLPKPDIEIFMDMPVEYSIDIMQKRENKSETKDIHENNISFLEDVYKNSLYICHKLEWKRIQCVNDSGIKSEEEIFKDILKLLEFTNILTYK